MPAAAPRPRTNLRIEPQPPDRRKSARGPIPRPSDNPSVALHALIANYRLHGWRIARLDPLNSLVRDPLTVKELNPAVYGLAPDPSIDFSIEFGGLVRTLSLPELLSRLRTSYCGTTVLDCAHLRRSDEQRWLYAQQEAQSDAPLPSAAEGLRILGELVATETFEHYRRAKYPAHKQFSLEGSDSLVTLLRIAIEAAAKRGVEDIVLGMPHRGRLNLMLHALGVPAKQVLSLFSASPNRELAKNDLRDHAGVSTRVHTDWGDVRVLLVHNPSHLESVSPVACGIARALQDRKLGGSGRGVLPILIHGDASFSAQGIVPETLNLSQTRGYGTLGTLHLILNNQIGSTVSDPRDARSTQYCADLARAIDAPILHVNADDPDAVAAVAQMATDYRMTFGADIVVDHVGYRRHGHFGIDDPKVTQPALQRRIRGHASVASIYSRKLAARGVEVGGVVEDLRTTATAALSEEESRACTPDALAFEGAPHRERSDPIVAAPVTTAVPLVQLQAIVCKLTEVPPRFALHDDIRAMLRNWRPVAGDGDRAVDWCLAENLAYGSLLANGFNVRLSGLDVGRGSFFHRYHVWHDQAAGNDWDDVHLPLRHVADGQGTFSIFESPLSEEAVLGFEYGYSLRCGRDLVVWEAQFGDFVNNAQVIIDQYIASGESKWEYKSGLVMLLPHGDEGGGPEHSCAYLGRFLQLCAEGNLRVAMPSTSGQLYHLLRRQALADDRKPLVVMTPKTHLYARRSSYSQLHELARAEFHALLGDDEVDPAEVTRVVLTSGKLYYDLVDGRSNADLSGPPILRVEQLYPFPCETLAAELRRYSQLREVIWAQEEAKNHGAWGCVRDWIEAALPLGVSLRYAGRPATPATAGCNQAAHANQYAIVASALGLA